MPNISYPKYTLPDDLEINSVTASSGVSGSHYGDGSGLTNVSLSSINPEGILVVDNLEVSNNSTFNDITVNGTASINVLNTIEQNSLKIGDKYITILSGANNKADLDGAGVLFGSGSIEEPYGVESSVASIIYKYASNSIEIFPNISTPGIFTGDGSGLYNLPIDLSPYLTAVDAANTYATLTGVSASFTTPTQVSGAITGALTSYATVSGVSGAIANFPTRIEITGTLSSYATLTGLSASFTTPTQVSGAITGAISNFPTRTEVSGAITGALTPYALSSNISSSFGLKTDISSSFARLAGGNTFTSGDQTITGSVNILGQSVLNGGQKVKITNKIASYTLTASSDYIIAFNGTNLTGTLPSASLCEGTTFIVKNKNSSPLFITSSEGLIDGASNTTINNQYYSYTLVSDGTDWNVI